MTTPFTQPAPKGQSPYWLRPRDPLHERQHRALLKAMERRAKAMRS